VLAFSISFACAVCGAAEPTLPSNGTEIPFEGRKRATLELRAAAFETWDHRLRIVELRAQPGVAIALGSATILSGEVPLLRRSLALEPRTNDTGASTSATSSSATQLPALAPRDGASTSSSTFVLGDVELRASHTAYASAPANVMRRLTVSAGLKLPTAPLERDPSGTLVHPDLQPGCGSIVPMLSISHAWSSSLWSAWTGASILFPVAVRDGSHPGDSLRGSITMQLQPSRILATRLGAHGRLDGAGELDGEVVRRSGGASVHVAPEIVLSPRQDVVVSAGASFPVVQEMRGYRATAPVLLASIGVDF
jgi:hypothetical protein